jgi:hypothetical protein
VTTISEYQQKIVAETRSFLGIPYVYGGASRSGVDCSGLTLLVAASIGVVMSHGSAAQFDTPEAPLVVGALEPGDFVYFEGGEFTGPRPGHVGIYIDDHRMINAPYTGVNVSYADFYTTTTWGAMAYYGAIRPALIAVPAPTPDPMEAPMLIEVTSSPSGDFTVGSYWEYGVGATGRVLYHVATPAQADLLKGWYTSVKQMSGTQLVKDIHQLSIKQVG